MTLPVVQICLVTAAGYLLFLLWRSIPFDDARLRGIAALGFLVRAFAGALLFVISFWNLPVGRSLQSGHGTWFFAVDGTKYFQESAQFAAEGLPAILTVNRSGASPTYQQAFASFIALFGEVASTALLLNLFCYLATIALLVRFGKLTPARKSGAALAIAAVAFAPSLILWSLQPLKENLFLLLIVAFIAGAAAWHRAWESRGVKLALTGALVMLACEYGIAGLRWYVAFAMLGASAVFLGLSALLSRQKALASISGAVLFMLLFRMWVASSEPYIPFSIRKFFTPAQAARTAAEIGTTEVLGDLAGARRLFDLFAATSTIGVGKRLAPVLPAARHVPVSPEYTTNARIPTTHGGRMIVGLLALLVPRFIAQPLGLLEIGGNAAMFAYVDLDTLLFDLVLVIALVSLFRHPRRASPRNPLFWLVVLTGLFVAVPLLYTVSNFGTLFRLRVTFFTVVALMPLALAFGERAAVSVPETREAGLPVLHGDALT